MFSSSRTSFSFSHAELVVAIVGFLVLSHGEMPDTQTVRGASFPARDPMPANPYGTRNHPWDP